MYDPEQSETLHRRVRALIERSARDGANESELVTLARDISVFQWNWVPVIRRLYESRGLDPRDISALHQIPAVPTDVFALTRVAAHPPELDARVFRTSGTTRMSAPRGVHALRTLDTYRSGARTWAARLLFGEIRPRNILALMPSSADAPESSLSFMVDDFASHLGATLTHRVDTKSGLDTVGILKDIAKIQADGHPTLLMGTSFAFVHLLDAVTDADALRLPAGSRAMFTGGFKGRSRSVEASWLRTEIASRFGINEGLVIGEYGMTELSSQLYEPAIAETVQRPSVPCYVAPPWVRVTAVDDVTLTPVEEGVEGIARIVDLANIDSAIAIQTADRVVVTGEQVELRGRAAGATPRGCALAADEMLGAE